MQRIRIDLTYDGRDFHGFQSQPDGLTIQDHLEKSLGIATRCQLRVTSASRTDSGVSAEHQVVTCEVDPQTDLFRLHRSLNGLLPKSIRVKSVVRCAREFHPAFDALGKIYRYRIWMGECLDPFSLPMVWELKHPLNPEMLQKTIGKYVGRHDFRAFANMGTDVSSTVRTVFDAKVEIRGSLINIWFSGDGFLKQMIRNMVGTAIDECIGRLSHSIEDLLKGTSRELAGRTAPAHGLQLVRIFYHPLPHLDPFIKEYNKDSGIVFGG